MKTATLIFFLLCFSVDAFPCINEYRTLLSGELVYSDMSAGTARRKYVDTTSLVQESTKLLRHYEETNSIESLSDYAAALVYLGQYQQAKSIYHRIESQSPDRYATASNLGTIYELIGMPDSALFWIKKAIVIDPNSHEGSEWIHIKILEYKLQADKDMSSSILDLDFGDEPHPNNPGNRDLYQLRRQLDHQLSERLYFISPPNEIVGNLLADYGHISAQTRDVQAALACYRQSRTFDFQSPLVDKRVAALEELAKKANILNVMEEKTGLRGDMLLGLLTFAKLLVYGLFAVVCWILVLKVFKSW